MPVRRRERLVEKKVFFYRLFVDGEPVRRANQFDFASVTRTLDASPYSDEGRFEADEDDAIISCFIDGASTLRFGRIRRSNLPPIADGPNISNITVPPDAGLFECCHVRYFGNGILGAEFNHYAPRIASRLASYLARKAAIDRHIDIRAIVRGSPLQAFRRFNSVRSVSVKVATTEQRALANAGGGLIARIAAASAREGVETVEFTLATARGRARRLSENIIQAVEGVLKMPNVRESIEKLSAKGYVAGRNTAEIIDLLEDDLVVSKQFLRESLRTKTLEAADAYAKINEAYTEIRDIV